MRNGYVVLDKPQQILDAYAKIKELGAKNVAIDTEFDTYTPEYAVEMARGTGRKARAWTHSPAETIGMSVSVGPKFTFYAPLHGLGMFGTARKFIKMCLRDGMTLWAWNWKAEWKALGITPTIGDAYYDAMVLAWFLEEGVPFYEAGKLRYKYGLKECAAHLLGEEMQEFKELTSGKVLVSGVTEEENMRLYSEEIANIHAEFAPKPPTKKALNEARKNYNARARACVYRKKMAGDIPVEEIAPYACDDALMTWRLASLLKKKAKEQGLWETFEKYEVPITRITHNMEQRGIRVDVPFFEQKKKELSRRVDKLEQLWLEKAGCDIRSAKQCADALYNQLKCWPKSAASYTAKGSLAVNKKALAIALDACPEGSLGRELALIKKEHSKLYKLVTAYMSEFIFQGKYNTSERVHARTSQIGTNTGRFAMKNPNLQSTPKEIIREGIVAESGYVFVCADWSSLEIVVMGHFSKDAAITEIVLSGKSQHDVTAEGVGVERSVAKTLNFGLNYGGGATTIARTLNVPLEKMRLRSGEEVMVAPQYIREWVKKYNETYEGVVRWRAQVAAECAEKGYVTTLMGRRRKLPGIYSSDRGEKAAAERQAYNTPIQGTAAEIAKASMVALERILAERFPDARMVLQVHDEILVECRADEAEAIKEIMKDVMANTIKLDLPLKAEVNIGKTWMEAK